LSPEFAETSSGLLKTIFQTYERRFSMKPYSRIIKEIADVLKKRFKNEGWIS